MLRSIGYHQTESVPYTDIEWYTIPMAHVRLVRYCDKVVMCYLLGRDGQTMQPEFYRRDFPIVIRLTTSIVKQWCDLCSKTSPVSQTYAQALLEEKIDYIYHFVLREPPTQILNQALIDFDLTIKDLLPNCYVKLSKVRTTSLKIRFKHITLWRKFRFRYIALWRKTYSTSSILFKIYYAYEKR
jgi:hypothetical protein